MAGRPTDPIRDAILERALPQVPFDGWTWALAEQSAKACGHDPGMAHAVFPGGLPDFVGHFSRWADDKTMTALAPVDISALRVRDRIARAVMTRLEILAPHRESFRLTATYWSAPHRQLQGGRIVWRSADRIWIWAGDTATDYNHYTKRALLSGVIVSTALAWLADGAGDLHKTRAFLDRRIENIMQIGRVTGRFKKTA